MINPKRNIKVSDIPEIDGNPVHDVYSYEGTGFPRSKISSEPIVNGFNFNNACGDVANSLTHLSIGNDHSINFLFNNVGDQVAELNDSIELTSTSSSLDTSASESRSLGPRVRVERRCRLNSSDDQYDQSKIQRCNGYRRSVVRLSTSLSCSNLSNRSIAIHSTKSTSKINLPTRHEKEKDGLNNLQTLEEEERLQKEKIEKQERARENFLKWVERKKKESKLETKSKTTKKDEDSRVVNKINFCKWVIRKQIAKKEQEEKKTQNKIEEEKRNREEKEERKEKNTKAYEEWYKRSKTTRKPATQGLLPHQVAKPTYVNPHAWNPSIGALSTPIERNSK